MHGVSHPHEMENLPDPIHQQKIRIARLKIGYLQALLDKATAECSLLERKINVKTDPHDFDVLRHVEAGKTADIYRTAQVQAKVQLIQLENERELS